MTNKLDKTVKVDLSIIPNFIKKQWINFLEINKETVSDPTIVGVSAKIYDENNVHHSTLVLTTPFEMFISLKINLKSLKSDIQRDKILSVKLSRKDWKDELEKSINSVITTSEKEEPIKNHDIEISSV